MEKPFSMIFRETKQGIVDIINNSGMPIDVVQSMLEVILYEVSTKAESMFGSEMREYSESLQQENAQDDAQIQQEETSDD